MFYSIVLYILYFSKLSVNRKKKENIQSFNYIIIILAV